MPSLVATPAAGCRGMTACRLTVWCQLLIHGPAEMGGVVGRWGGREAEGQHG